MNHREIEIKDGEDWKELQTTTLKNVVLTLQNAQTPLITFLYACEVVSSNAIINFQQTKIQLQHWKIA